MAAADGATQTWAGLLVDLFDHRDLTLEQTSWAMDEVMSGQTNAVTLAGFLAALATKGYTVAELRGLADTMRAHAVPVRSDVDAVDIVGTGGDRHRSVNISTMAALVVAGAGVPVAKHGNRAASSASGSADVLEALGVRLDLGPERAAELIGEVGITFLFAQQFHPAMRHAAAARSGLGVPTAFNFLGPLTNPAHPRAGAIGVGNPAMAPIMAGVFADRGTSTLVFRSNDGLDELSTTAPARVWDVTAAADGRLGADGAPAAVELDLTEVLDLAPATLDDLRGADPAFNAAVARAVLAGERGAVRDAVLVNAAAALVADGRVPGTAEGPLAARLRAGVAAAAAAVDDGRAQDVLARWVEASRR